MTEFLLFLSLLGNSVALYHWWSRRNARMSMSQRTQAEQAILGQALFLRGRVTAIEVAARSRLPVAHIEAALREMNADNQCLCDLDFAGRAIYVFPQFDDSVARREAVEREILRLAHIHNAELTVEKLAMSTDLTLTEAHQWLHEMAARGSCTQLDDAGTHFRFDRLIRKQQGRGA